jgi:3-deoxy-D-manno-octulosonate 8-phosphate phosphatase (KDO 8-P phosphatase)
LRIVGLPVAVANAVPEVAALCRLHLTRRGGHGAVREFTELLLRARGEWDSVCDAYVSERSVVGEESQRSKPRPAPRTSRRRRD